MNTQMDDTQYEVLVVGAGPTGLMAANLLKRSGVRVGVIDERAQASRESRASAITARSMELFGQLGLADSVLDRGVIAPGIDVFIAGQRVGGLDYDRANSPDTPYPFLTLYPQNGTEKVLLDDLARLGVAVRREVNAVSLEEDESGVTVQVASADGRTSAIRSGYVIGADGAHSMVRKALGLSFDGDQYAQTFMLADCKVEWPAGSAFDHARFRIFIRGDTIALFLPIDGARRSRVMATDLGGAEAGQLDLAELQHVYREATGVEVRLCEPVWTTRYRVHHRGVSSYGTRRVFVAGDAGHIHSPAGGQGMNTGLQDAANLAWKLSAVIRGGAPVSLLRTYDTERLPVGQQVISTSDKIFQTFAGRTGWEARMRDWFARPAAAAMSHSNSMQRNAFRKLAQLEIAYPEGEFVEDAAASLGSDGPCVGGRAPDARIDARRTVFDLMRGYGFTVWALSRKPLEDEDSAALLDALRVLSGDKRVVHLVTRTVVGRHDDRVIVPTSPEIFERYGVEARDGQMLYVIRPDGYVAWRGHGLPIEAAHAFLQRFGARAS